MALSYVAIHSKSLLINLNSITVFMPNEQKVNYNKYAVVCLRTAYMKKLFKPNSSFRMLFISM